MLQEYSPSPADQLIELGDCAKQHRKEIKSALNFTITDTMAAVQIAHQLLEQLGVPVKQRCWSNKSEGHEGEKLRIYGVDPTEWDELQLILTRRRLKRQGSTVATGSPPVLSNSITNGGDPESYEYTFIWEEEQPHTTTNNLHSTPKMDGNDPIRGAA